MSPHRRLFWFPSARFAAITVLMLMAPSRGLLAGSKARSVNRPVNAFDSAAIARARAGAARRLQDPNCLRLLTDYTDRRGRTLDQNLGSWGLSASDYLQQLPFFDGSSTPNCRRSSVELVTAPGLPPVFVCLRGLLNSRFAQVQIRNPSFAEVMLIHEMLHTLGLGENPPSTFDITMRIQGRCQ